MDTLERNDTRVVPVSVVVHEDCTLAWYAKGAGSGIVPDDALACAGIREKVAADLGMDSGHVRIEIAIPKGHRVPRHMSAKYEVGTGPRLIIFPDPAPGVPITMARVEGFSPGRGHWGYDECGNPVVKCGRCGVVLSESFEHTGDGEEDVVTTQHACWPWVPEGVTFRMGSKIPNDTPTFSLEYAVADPDQAAMVDALAKALAEEEWAERDSRLPVLDERKVCCFFRRGTGLFGGWAKEEQEPFLRSLRKVLDAFGVPMPVWEKERARR